MLLHQNDRHATLRHHLANDVEQLLHDQRRQAFERFVQQQDTRVQHQRAADGQHLALAAGQLGAHVGAALAQAREGRVDALQRPVAGSGDHRQVFFHGQRREHVALLRHPAQAQPGAAVAGLAGDVLPVEEDAPVPQAGCPHQGGEQGRLAHAVAPQQRQAAAGAERERQLLQHDGVAIAGANVFHTQQLSHGTPPDRPRARAGAGR